MSDDHDVTRILHRLENGDSGAVSELLPVVYSELRGMAHKIFRRESPGHTLQPTAIVHEAYLNLVDQKRARYQDRLHFLAVAATAMRRILIDHARSRKRDKRGGNRQRVELDERLAVVEGRNVDLMDLDEALLRLAEIDSRKARIVELRFFGGLTTEEIAEELEVSPKTVKRDWAVAKGWLYREMSNEHEMSSEL